MPARINNPGQPLAPEELAAIERRLGVRQLPSDYRSFLLTHNGGTPTPGWFRYGKDPRDVAEITQFWTAAEMESETKALGSAGVPNLLVSIGTVSDEDLLLLSLAAKHQGAVFWNPNHDDPADLDRFADSFDKLLAGLDYVDSTKPWMMLIDNNDLEGLKSWLDAGGSAQAEDDIVMGRSALEHATYLGRNDMVELLLARRETASRGGSSGGERMGGVVPQLGAGLLTPPRT